MLPSYEITLNSHLKDLNPITAGEQGRKVPGIVGLTPPSPFTLIHHVVSGRGTYYYNGKTYVIHAGQAFITPPTDQCRCEADEDDPWTYRWVGFTGTLSSDFWEIPLVFDAEDDIFPHLKNLDTPSPTIELELAADLMLLHARLISTEILRRGKERTYTRDVIDFIHNFYARNPSIQDIADHVALNRDYISRIFKNETGRSIQSFLSEVRITNAMRLLDTGMPVEKVAEACGFNSATHFSRQFKTLVGLSPQSWIKKMKIQAREGYVFYPPAREK